MFLSVVYLGPSLPKYVIENLIHLKTTFSSYETVFLSDSPKSIEKVKKTGVTTWLLEGGENWADQRDRLEHPMDFRQEFWFRTIARFFVLNEYLKTRPQESTLQIEADVYIFPYIPLNKIEELACEIAYPMESASMGIASLLFLKNQNSCNQLVEISKKMISDNGRNTDMSILGAIAKFGLMNFASLQIIPRELTFALRSNENFELYCHDYPGMEGVFDGISLGQYLLGIDPRNNRGKLILYSSQSSHAIDASKLKFGLNSLNELVLMHGEKTWRIYNLHNHSKDARIFSNSKNQKIIRKQVMKNLGVEVERMKPRMFLKLASKYLIEKALLWK
jgi:hypothetical protein